MNGNDGLYFLAEKAEHTAEWRHALEDSYPDDHRNARAVAELQSIARELVDAEFGRTSVARAFCEIDGRADADDTSRLFEIISEVLRTVGFSGPCTATGVLEDILFRCPSALGGRQPS
jgi:hypothetical protein